MAHFFPRLTGRTLAGLKLIQEFNIDYMMYDGSKAVTNFPIWEQTLESAMQAAGFHDYTIRGDIATVIEWSEEAQEEIERLFRIVPAGWIPEENLMAKWCVGFLGQLEVSIGTGVYLKMSAMLVEDTKDSHHIFTSVTAPLHE